MLIPSRRSVRAIALRVVALFAGALGGACTLQHHVYHGTKAITPGTRLLEVHAPVGPVEASATTWRLFWGLVALDDVSAPDLAAADADRRYGDRWTGITRLRIRDTDIWEVAMQYITLGIVTPSSFTVDGVAQETPGSSQ